MAALLPVASVTPSLPAQLTAQLGHAAQLAAASAVQHPTSANLNLNLAAAAALAGVHPLSAASTLALSGTLGAAGGTVISPVGGVPSLSGGSTGTSLVSSGVTGLTNSSSSNNNSGNSSSSGGGGSGASGVIATDSNKSDLQVVILD